MTESKTHLKKLKTVLSFHHHQVSEWCGLFILKSKEGAHQLSNGSSSNRVQAIQEESQARAGQGPRATTTRTSTSCCLSQLSPPLAPHFLWTPSSFHLKMQCNSCSQTCNPYLIRPIIDEPTKQNCLRENWVTVEIPKKKKKGEKSPWLDLTDRPVFSLSFLIVLSFPFLSLPRPTNFPYNR